jgi:putrescine transport system ATP-binding protein
MLAGFEQPEAGRIVLGSEDITAVPPHRRPVNMMFQSYALFPHMSVAANIAFGLRQEGMPKAEIGSRVAEMLALVKLEGMDGRYPQQLSGGQRQRVALARALAKRPKVLLLDEPLSALDRKLREETRSELKELQRRLRLTFIVVTHDQEEAMTMADRIGVMRAGRLVQAATPPELYERPNSRWIAEFVGDINLFEGKVIASDQDRCTVEIAMGNPIHVTHSAGLPPGTPVWIAVRPEGIEMGSAPTETRNVFQGHVFEIAYLGSSSLIRIKLDNGTIVKVAAVNLKRQTSPMVGDRVAMSFDPESVILLQQ